MSNSESRLDNHWAAVRAEFPALRNRTFLNTATFGQLPRAATEAVAQHLAHRDELACADFLSWFEDMDAIRQKVATLIHCSAEDIAFIPNAATGLSLLMGSIDWKPGDRVLTLQNEFPNNLYWPSLLRSEGVEFLEVPWEDLYANLTGRTRLVMMSTVNYSTGFRVPVVELGQALRERGILYYLDGTQSLGAMQFDVRTAQPDVLAAHAYKWLLSPNGAAFLYVSPAFRERLKPNVIGWRSHKDWRRVDSLHHGAPDFVASAEKYEGGMLNFPSLYAMGASLEMMLQLGPEQIEARVMWLASLCADILEKAGGEIAYRGSSILTARFPHRDVARMASELKERQILVSARHGRLRVSTHFYNNEDDLARLQDALNSSR